MKMVKNLILFVPAAMALTACDGWNKSPSSDLETMRGQAKVITQMGPDKPREIVNTKIEKEEKQVVYYKTAVDASVISINQVDDDMTFSEGKESSFKIRASVAIKGATMKLVASDLPAGASMKYLGDNIYVITWTPALYTVPSDKVLQSFKVKLTGSIVNPGQVENADQVKALTKDTTVRLTVLRSQESPSELTVSGLAATVSEDQEVPFVVTVKVPGFDGKSPVKPRLNISYDRVTVTANNNLQESDGSRYINADKNTEAQYIGDSKWKFSYVFDTKNISVKPQLNKDGSIAQTADGSLVRFSVKAFGPNGLSTPEKLVQVKIKYSKAIAAPRFDVSGLGKTNLEVSAGEKIVLKFFASSSDKNAVVNVETKNSTLAGKPQVTCADSSAGASKQDCTLTWEVPCDATAEAVTGTVDMTATSTVDGRISQVTNYSLKTAKAAQDKGLCQTAVAAKTEAK